MSLLVSRACFDALTRFDKEVLTYCLVKGAFDLELRTIVAEKGEAGNERVERWVLLHHAEIGQSMLMVMGWVEQSTADSIVYSTGYAANRFNSPKQGAAKKANVTTSTSP